MEPSLPTPTRWDWLGNEQVQILEAWALDGRIPRSHEMQQTMDTTTDPDEWEALHASKPIAPRNRKEARDMARHDFSRMGRKLLGFGRLK